MAPSENDGVVWRSRFNFAKLIKLCYLACKDEGLTRTQYGFTAKIRGVRQLKMIMFINCKQASHQQDMEFYLYKGIKPTNLGITNRWKRRIQPTKTSEDNN